MKKQLGIWKSIGVTALLFGAATAAAAPATWAAWICLPSFFALSVLVVFAVGKT